MNTEKSFEYPLVSIVVPTYNNENRIARTLECLISQDYLNIEIIVVNDNSTDSTKDTAQNILSGWGGRFSVINRNVNGGPSASRNNGFDAAHGKYVIFFDNDDLAEKNYVSSLCAEAERVNADMVFCGYKDYYETDKRYVLHTVRINRPLSQADDYIKARMSRKFLSGVWCFIFKKEFLERIHLRFWEGCHCNEDNEFLLKAIALSQKISFIKPALYTYIHHSAQLSTGRSEQNMQKQSMISVWRTIRYISRKGTKRGKYYMIHFYFPERIVKMFTNCAHEKNKSQYEAKLVILRHKKIRKLLFSTVRFFNIAPSLFLKSVMLLYFPRLYYSLRA